VRDGEAPKGGGSDGVAAAQALGAAEWRRKSGDGSKALRSIGSTTSGGASSYLLARLLGGFTATKRRRSRGFDDGGGKLELGFRRLASRAKGGAGCSGRRSRVRRRP
jgi:hypothetical protein